MQNNQFLDGLAKTLRSAVAIKAFRLISSRLAQAYWCQEEQTQFEQSRSLLTINLTDGMLEERTGDEYQCGCGARVSGNAQFVR